MNLRELTHELEKEVEHELKLDNTWDYAAIPNALKCASVDELNELIKIHVLKAQTEKDEKEREKAAKISREARKYLTINLRRL